MAHKRLIKIEAKRNLFGEVYCVYSRNFGSEGGWHLLQCFREMKEAEEYKRTMED